MAKPPKQAYDLTDAEKRDLTQLIQQGKALPEKYRFILFSSLPPPIRVEGRLHRGSPGVQS